jgi:histone deacetylase 1/2
MALLEEASTYGIPVKSSKAKVLCNLFCDNQSACELIRLPKVRPRTKHFNSKLHHFREHVADGSITVQYIPTGEQLADIATKPLAFPLFSKFRTSILGW